MIPFRLSRSGYPVTINITVMISNTAWYHNLYMHHIRSALRELLGNNNMWPWRHPPDGSTSVEPWADASCYSLDESTCLQTQQSTSPPERCLFRPFPQHRNSCHKLSSCFGDSRRGRSRFHRSILEVGLVCIQIDSRSTEQHGRGYSGEHCLFLLF